MAGNERPQIDEEIAALIPPLDDSELEHLEASLLDEGCRDPLVVWQETGILLDGHHRLALCERHGLAYRLQYLSFATRDEALAWVIRNQLGRRNLTLYQRARLALALRPLLAARARARREQAPGAPRGTKRAEHSRGLAGESSDDPNLDHQKAESGRGRSLRQAAQAADVGASTLHQVSVIEQQAPETVRQMARMGDLAIYRAYQITRALALLPEEERERAAELCGDSVDKALILARLYRSAQRPESSETYQEILRTGGFHYTLMGDGEEARWCDFAATTADAIGRALRELARQHAALALEGEADVERVRRDALRQTRAIAQRLSQVGEEEAAADWGDLVAWWERQWGIRPGGE